MMKEDPAVLATLLSDVLREKDAYIGGSSMGKGLVKAARYILRSQQQEQADQQYAMVGASDLNSDILENPECPIEESFYIVDLGVIISQFYQWRLKFPRVEPFYAVKCNPDPAIIRTVAILGGNFDCASRNEIRLVQDVTKDLARTPEIIYANPCKARAHLIEAVCRGVKRVTFDNVSEVVKCARVSRNIELILRIVTDDRGSQCRLSSKFGAPRSQWKPLLNAAKTHGMQVVGVSFHVGSGCRDASRYGLALKDAKEIFIMAEKEYGFKMNLLDIGGGFPGETHSIWNPVDLDVHYDKNNEILSAPVEEEEEEEDDETMICPSKEGLDIQEHETDSLDGSVDPSTFMFFSEIADKVRPMIDELFPPSSGIRLISEPGRYFVAASGTLFASVISARQNTHSGSEVDRQPKSFDDEKTSQDLFAITREEEKEIVKKRGVSNTDCSTGDEGAHENNTVDNIIEEMGEYSKLYAMQNLMQQEADVYNDGLDLYKELDLDKEGFDTAIDVLGPPDVVQMHSQVHSVEGVPVNLVSQVGMSGSSGYIQSDSSEGRKDHALLTLASAGEAAVNGVMLQAVAESLQDYYAYYVNDGVYGAFNNLMFDHATVRPRKLRYIAPLARKSRDSNRISKDIILKETVDGFRMLQTASIENKNGDNSSDDEEEDEEDNTLYSSTVFGPTCDSMDVISRSVLLPKLKIGDWLYFQNMGAYTCAAASSFNGFSPSKKVYVCSVPPKFFRKIIAGPDLKADEATTLSNKDQENKLPKNANSCKYDVAEEKKEEKED